MANRAIVFVSAIFVGAIVGIPVSVLARDAAAVGDIAMPEPGQAAASSSTDCLTAPSRELPAGQRWFYRLEPGTNRRCWYLRDNVPERASLAATPRSNTQQSTSQTSPQSQPGAASQSPRTVARTPQASRSLSNARAESTGAESTGVTVPKTPVFITTTGSAGGNRGTSIGTNAFQGPNTTLTSADQTDAMNSSPDATAAEGSGVNTGLSPFSPEAPGMNNMPQDKASASLQVLFLVILGALGFAGIMASLIHRMARSWARRHPRPRRDSIWRVAAGSWDGAGTAAAQGRSKDRRATTAQRDGHSGQIKRFLAQLTKPGGGKSKKRVLAKPQAASAARARTPSTRRGVRASAVRP